MFNKDGGTNRMTQEGKDEKKGKKEGRKDQSLKEKGTYKEGHSTEWLH